MSRARASGLLRASAAAAAAAFASRRIQGDASGAFSEPASASTPPDPAGLDAPVAAAYPTTAANKSTAQWRVYTDVARDLSSRGDLEAAGVYLRRALAEARAGFGEEDPHVAAARNNLAELYRLQRRFDEAEKLYAVAAAALEKHYGPSHPAAGAAVHNLAGCKLSRGDFAGAYRAYAAAAAKKKKALGANHPDYAATLFHMAEAKRAGGDHAAAATLLEESVRVLDASGQGESAVACRRMERLAQAQGDLNGDHVAAETTRRRVLEAREHAAKVAGAFFRSEDSETEVARIEPGEALKAKKRPHETKTKTKTRVGFVGAAAAAAHGGAVASAAEAHAATLAELGRWDEAVSASRRAVEVHEARVETHLGSVASDGFGARVAAGAFASFAAALARARGFFEAFFDAGADAGAAPSEATDAAAAAAAGRDNLRLQLAASRVKCADVMARAARSEGAAEDFFDERAAMLAGALAETQRAAETAAGRLARLARPSGVSVAGSLNGADDAHRDDARTGAASLRRRESAAAPGRHVAALVLFGRAARGVLCLAAEASRGKKRVARASVGVDGWCVSLTDAKCHVGDAAEWLAAGSRAAARAEMDAAHRRALAGELRECRAALEKDDTQSS